MINAISFTGYRPNKYNFVSENKKFIYQKLICEITTCIKYGCTKYYFGGAPGFDLLAAYAVIYLKKVFDIKLICVLPYENFCNSSEFNEEWRNSYLSILTKCDRVINASGKKNESSSYMLRNKYMIDNSDILICLYYGKKGGTQNTIFYVQQKGLRIINILPL